MKPRTCYLILQLQYPPGDSDTYNCVELGVCPKSGIKGIKALKVLVRGRGQEYEEAIL